MKKHDIEKYIETERQALNQAVEEQIKSLKKKNNKTSSKMDKLEAVVKNPAVQSLTLTAVSILLEKISFKWSKINTPQEENSAHNIEEVELPSEPFDADNIIIDETELEPIDDESAFSVDFENTTSHPKQTNFSAGLMFVGFALTAAGIWARKK